MLRIAVISLLVANLLLLGFQGSKPATQPKTITKQTVVQDPGIPTIHLFGEMVEDQNLMSGNRRCFSLGPFHSVEDKNETWTLLEEVSANISERETQALVEKGYWVFMPPYESLLEANQALFSLQALGLKDIAVIYRGDWKNAISLGYFLRQENALRRKKDLEDRGFAPKIRVQRQSESRYWLDYEQNPGSGLITMDMQDRPNDFMQRSLPCPDQNPFETIAGVAEDLSVEMKQPQTQLPEEETQLPPEEIIEPQLKENNDPQPEEIGETQPDEVESLQLEDGGGPPPTEEIDLDAEVSTDTAPVDNTEAEATGPEATGPAIETEQEASDLLADDTLENQVEIPEVGGESQSIGDDGVDPDEVIDSTPVDVEKTLPESATETKPENSVGTGPVIGFGTEPEDSDETEVENSDEAGVEDSFGTESKDSDGTETDNG